jgi:hypothetical protein
MMMHCSQAVCKPGKSTIYAACFWSKTLCAINVSAPQETQSVYILQWMMSILCTVSHAAPDPHPVRLVDLILGHAERFLAGAWRHPLLEGKGNASAAYTVTLAKSSAFVSVVQCSRGYMRCFGTLLALMPKVR